MDSCSCIPDCNNLYVSGVLRKKRNLFRSASGASKFFERAGQNEHEVLDRMSMKYQNKLGGCMRVKTKLFKGLQSAGGERKKERNTTACQVWPHVLRKGHLKGRAPPLRPRGRASTEVYSSKLAPTMGPTTRLSGRPWGV
eukprot:1142675-Pelagomonas_calceolata.AAC.3